MTYWNGHGMNGWGFALMTVSTLLVLGLMVVGVVLLARWLGRTPAQPPARTPAGGPTAPPAPEPADPERLLAERLARGEIDPDEYRQRLDALRGARAGRRLTAHPGGTP